MLTVNNKKEQVDRANELGVIDYLVKQELRLSEIVDKVVAHLSN